MTEIAWLKPEQVESMRDAAYERTAHAQRNEAIITLLYDTGLRRDECAQLMRGLLDLEASELRLPGNIQKDYPTDSSPAVVTFELDQSGDLRTVRTLRSYLHSLEPLPAPEDPLFQSQKGGGLTGKAINDVVKMCADAADVRPHTETGRGSPTDVSAHTLRHSVAYRMLRSEEGHGIYDVKNRLRHATVQTTEQNYAHFDTV